MATSTKASSPLSSTEYKKRATVKLPGRKSEDFVLTAHCRILNVRGRVTMACTELPGQAAGSYQWTTASTKIRLLNSANPLVTVEALAAPSASRDAETLTVTRTGTDGKKTVKTVKVTVAKVSFSASAAQSYGYDDFDTPANPDDNHLCVRSSDHSVVKVTIEGGALGSDFDFVCDPSGICTPAAPPAGATFDLRLDAQRHQKAQTLLQAKVKCPSAQVFAKLGVHVYSQKVVNVTIAKVSDSRRPASTLAFATANYAAHQTAANGKLKEAVVKYVLTNYDAGNAVKDIPFDLDGSGLFTFDINAGGGPEARAIASALPVTDPNQYLVVIVRKMQSLYYLSRAASIGDTTVTVRGSNVFTGAMPLGTGAGMEMVTVVSNAGNVGTLAAPLTRNHAVGATLEFGAGAWGGGNPIFIQEGSAPLDVAKWTVLHEVGHSALSLSDIVDITDFMHFQQSWTDYRLRYCPRIKKYGAHATQNQWESIPRPVA